MARKKWIRIEKAGERQEIHAQHAFMAIVPAVLCLIAGTTLNKWFQSWFPLFAPLLIGFGIILAIYALIQFVLSKFVNEIEVTCPYCKEKNLLVKTPESEFRCDSCQRMIPAEKGLLLQVFEVRCGYCNALNYYHEKSTGLICEGCNRVIPIANEESEDGPTKAFEMFSIHDDEDVYDLGLVDPGPKTEEMIDCLQHMLALNRNQVKQMFDELPVTLLTGVPKKKADLLSVQINSHGGITTVTASKR